MAGGKYVYITGEGTVKRAPRRRRMYNKGSWGLNKVINKKIETKLNRMTEMKYHNTYVSATGVSNTASVGLMTDNNQSTGDTEHIGDSFRVKDLQLRFRFVAADIYNYIRVIIFQWKPSNVTPPTAADILLPGVTANPDITSFYVHDAKKQFRILYDRLFKLTGNGTANYPMTTGSVLAVNKTLKIKNGDVRFYGGSNSNGENHIYYLVVSDSTAATHPTWEMNYLYNYTDL